MTLFSKLRTRWRAKKVAKAVAFHPNATWKHDPKISALTIKDIDGNVLAIAIYSEPKPLLMVRDSAPGFLLAQELMLITALLGPCIVLGAVVSVDSLIAAEAPNNEQEIH